MPEVRLVQFVTSVEVKMALVENEGPARKLPTAVNVPLPYATPWSVTELVPQSRLIQLVALVEVRSTPSPAATNCPAPNETAYSSLVVSAFWIDQVRPSGDVRISLPPM